MNAWDDLPNGKRIDAVLAHYKAHPDRWSAAYLALTIPEASREAAWVAAVDSLRDAIWGAAWNAASTSPRFAAREAACFAARALVAWDEAGDMLDMSVEEVQALAMVGIHAAVLLLPAAIAMNERM